jgi:hypothetical protein
MRHMQRLVRAHLLEAVIPIGQTDHALGVEQAEHLLTDRPFGDLAQRCKARQQERQVEHLEVLDTDRAELGVRRRQHLDRAELERFEFFLVLVKGRVWIDLNLDLAVGIFLGEFLEFFSALALRRVGRHDVAEFYDDGRLRHAGARSHENCSRSGRE